jgi:hypothetical protein
MLSPFEQRQLDENCINVVETARLIGQQDQIIIAGLCRGIDISEAEKKSGEMRLVLEGMKAQGRKLRQKLGVPEVTATFASIPVLFPNWLGTLRSQITDAELSIAGEDAQIIRNMRKGMDTREAEKVVERDRVILEDKKRVCSGALPRESQTKAENRYTGKDRRRVEACKISVLRKGKPSPLLGTRYLSNLSWVKRGPLSAHYFEDVVHVARMIEPILCQDVSSSRRGGHAT